MGKEKLEEKIEDADSAYYDINPQPEDKRKQAGIETYQNGKQEKAEEYPLDSEMQIAQDKTVEKRRNEVYSDRAAFIKDIRQRMKKIPAAIAKMKEGYKRPIEVDVEPTSAGKTVSAIAATEAGASPTLTLRGAYDRFISREADKAGVHKPGRKEMLKNTAREYLLNHPNTITLPIYKKTQNAPSRSAFQSLKKGDEVVIYFGDHGHMLRSGLEKKGMKYIVPSKDGVYGEGPHYQTGMEEATGAKAVSGWAKKVYEKTGKKPKIVGFGERGANHVIRALSSEDISGIASGHAVAATAKNPNYTSTNYVNIFGTAGNQRKGYNPGARHNIEFKNATALDLAYNRSAEIIDILSGKKYSAKR